MKTNLAIVVPSGGAGTPPKPLAKAMPDEGKLADLASQISALSSEERSKLLGSAMDHFCMVCFEPTGDDWCPNGCFDGEEDDES